MKLVKASATNASRINNEMMMIMVLTIMWTVAYVQGQVKATLRQQGFVCITTPEGWTVPARINPSTARPECAATDGANCLWSQCHLLDTVLSTLQPNTASVPCNGITGGWYKAICDLYSDMSRTLRQQGFVCITTPEGWTLPARINPYNGSPECAATDGANCMWSQCHLLDTVLSTLRPNSASVPCSGTTGGWYKAICDTYGKTATLRQQGFVCITTPEGWTVPARINPSTARPECAATDGANCMWSQCHLLDTVVTAGLRPNTATVTCDQQPGSWHASVCNYYGAMRNTWLQQGYVCVSATAGGSTLGRVSPLDLGPAGIFPMCASYDGQNCLWGWCDLLHWIPSQQPKPLPGPQPCMVANSWHKDVCNTLKATDPSSGKEFCVGKPDKDYANPYDLSRRTYISCVGGQSGSISNVAMYVRTCASNLVYDEPSNACQYPPVSSTAVPALCNDNLACFCNGRAAGRYQNVFDSSFRTFVVCSNNKAGVQSCPDTTVWNPELSACDYPYNVAVMPKTCGKGVVGNGLCPSSSECCSAMGYCGVDKCSQPGCRGGPCVGGSTSDLSALLPGVEFIGRTVATVTESSEGACAAACKIRPPCAAFTYWASAGSDVAGQTRPVGTCLLLSIVQMSVDNGKATAGRITSVGGNKLYTTVMGDTVQKLARALGISTDTLRGANPLLTNVGATVDISPGTVVLLPNPFGDTTVIAPTTPAQPPSTPSTPPAQPAAVSPVRDTCWLASYGRGAGTAPVASCPSGHELQAGLCYPMCNNGENGVGPVCWTRCPSDHQDRGVFCAKDPVVQSSERNCPWWDTCGLTFARGCATCPGGFRFDGCTCWRDGSSIVKSARGRGAGTIPAYVCPSGTVMDAGLCYTPCRANFKGVGPVCWGATTPAGFPVKCSDILYGKTQAACDEVSSTGAQLGKSTTLAIADCATCVLATNIVGCAACLGSTLSTFVAAVEFGSVVAKELCPL